LARFQDKDSSHYFGASPEISLEKFTNQKEFAFVRVGEPLTWTYRVSNSGNVPLIDLAIEDSDPNVDPGFIGGDLDVNDQLDPGEIWIYEAYSLAIEGLYTNTATIEAGFIDDLGNQTTVNADASSGYQGTSPVIVIQKRTNGEYSPNPPGPAVLVGHEVTWTYHLTNTGDITLTEITLVDDPIGSIPCPDTVLAPDEAMTCSSSDLASKGQYGNTAVVSAISLDKTLVEASDTSHYFGADPEIDLEKHTNGQDADSPPGPAVIEGEAISWTYILTNTGNILLINIQVEDNMVGAIPCPQTTLEPQESMVCQESAVAIVGQYVNQGEVIATPQGLDTPISDLDLSHYLGGSPYWIYLPSLIR
jgi:uncharacterized repeat protein (TIGR01451 family)